MFTSNNFYYRGKYSNDYNIQLINNSNEVLQEKGLRVGVEPTPFTLAFTHSTDNGVPLVWDRQVIQFVYGWLFDKDTFDLFTSEDMEEIGEGYLVKPIEIIKKFNENNFGIIEVTFLPYTNDLYKKFELDILANVDTNVYNFSFEENYPVFELKNNNISNITIKNKTTTETFTIQETNTNNNITIDNKMGLVFDDKEKNIMFNSNRNWIKLDKGFNIINSNVDLKIKCLYRIWG